MWLFIEPFAMLKRVWPPPAPRSFAAKSGRLIASATKLVSSNKPFCSPLLAKYSGSPSKRSLKSRFVLKTKSTSPKALMITGALVTATKRARLPLELDALAGIVPDRGRAAAVEDVDHLLVELALRREALAGRDLAHVA